MWIVRSKPFAAAVLGLAIAGCSEQKAAPEPVASGTPATAPSGESAASVGVPGEPAMSEVSTSTSSTATADTTHVLLGSPELTAGIPGEGKLSIEQIQAWIDEPKNHEMLEIELPLGLSLGQGAIKIPADNPMTRAKIELGRQLYFDKRLSADNTVSCADCHHPNEGYARNTQFGIGIGKQEGGRNSPVAYNRIFSDLQFWDGRAESLEAQAVGPIANPIEMGNSHEAAVATVKGIKGYEIQFAKVFEDGVTIGNIGKAIATFERAIVTGPSPFDYYEPLRATEQSFAEEIKDLDSLKQDDAELYSLYMERRSASDAHPMSESAKRGREIYFTEKGGCSACHVGANLADERYHNLGVGMDQASPDLGRFVVTKDDKDRGAFKTPTVRNVELTAPYMHDGSLKTLEEVVEWYVKGGHPNDHLSKNIRRLELSDQDKADLVAFMKACTGEFPRVEQGRLPQ
jgi:cytochrome c peroxidase